MIELNLFGIIYLGSGIRRLSDISPGNVIGDWAQVIIEAKNALRSFRESEDTKALFPKSINSALMLGEVLSGFVPDLPPGTSIPNPKISEDEVANLRFMNQHFLTVVQQECNGAYAIALERQRVFDLHTLIESIETAFDIRVWNRFSEFSKEEIMESGRCLALERYTASGFHMLRAVENETRDCATLIAHAKPPRRDFGDYIQTLKLHGADSRLIAVLDNVKTLERNPLAHPEDQLNQDDAVTIFCIALALFSRLVADMEKRNILPPLEG